MCIACGPLMDALNSAFVKPSRRRFLEGSGATAIAAGFGGSVSQLLCSEAQAQADASDTLYVGGPIITMSDASPTAEAVLVRARRIVAVGKRSDVEMQAKVPFKAVDLEGKPLLPGFFDPHGHVVMIGLQALSANLLPAPDGEGNDIAAIQRLLEEWIGKNAQAIERYKLIIGFGYDDSQLKEQRHPTRDELDAVSKDVPVFIVHQSGHLGAGNSKALEVANVTAATKNPDGGVFRRRQGGAEPNGVCEEYAFFQVMGKLAARFDEEAYLSMIKNGADFCASFGYTTVQEARAMNVTAAMLSKAADKDLLSVDVLAYPDILDAVDSIKPSREYKNRYRVGGAKITIDGSPQGKTAWLTKPYYIPPEGQKADYVGYPSVSKEKATAAFDLAYSKRWQILVHANGDAAIDLMIACARQSTKKFGKGDRRTVLVHG